MLGSASELPLGSYNKLSGVVWVTLSRVVATVILAAGPGCGGLYCLPVSSCWPYGSWACLAWVLPDPESYGPASFPELVPAAADALGKGLGPGWFGP
ncbi:hypothetical protein DSO57_1003381 [Entomophthora muscae]|uniref:Uncharacterized protein n=1 Tax=Entomophthora muscae TaxID=34485 RepID=A0ACC2SXF2_9FUNG|nr:hypothetical protein DSO57_1003381 [Entomophthora muscae]